MDFLNATSVLGYPVLSPASSSRASDIAGHRPFLYCTPLGKRTNHAAHSAATVGRWRHAFTNDYFRPFHFPVVSSPLSLNVARHNLWACMLKHLWGCLQATADKIVALLLAHPHLRLDDVAVISRNVNMDRLLLQLYVSV